MSDIDPNFDPTAGEDLELEKALVEYANSMEQADRINFLQKLKDDQSYYLGMGKALSEMAMLIACAAVIEDDAEFLKRRRHIMYEAREDSNELVKMRLYYLNNRHAVDMDAVIDGDAAKVRFEQRLKEFLFDYQQQHPAS